MQVPFYANTEDNTHCFQAGVRMLLKAFYPDEEFEWWELDRRTCKVEGMWTWPMAGLLWLAEKGIEVKNIEMFDYERFAHDPVPYLYEFFTPEVAKAQIEHSHIEQEAIFAREFTQKLQTIKAIPTIDDIKKHIDDRYIVALNVNSKALNHKEGYRGHLVIIFDHDENGVIMHDPGLPPKPNRHVDFATLEKAWAYPDEKAKNLAAFRLAQPQ